MRLRRKLFVHPIETVRILVYHYRSAVYDWYLGINSSEVGVSYPPADSPYSHYDPTKPKFLRWIFRSLPIDFRKYSFVDIGSGKGRVLVAAARHRFIQVIGVEYSRELHQEALVNIQSARHLKCPKLESLCMDATQFAIPETPCVLFFYNPFQEPIMEQVLSNIRRSLQSFPRPLFIAYVNPVLHAQLIREPGLRLFKSGDWCNLYEWSIPHASGLT